VFKLGGTTHPITKSSVCHPGTKKETGKDTEEIFEKFFPV